ncbi:MAG: hypothetical protein WA996_17155 [Candidatus Promineifilaceae bacterium]
MPIPGALETYVDQSCYGRDRTTTSYDALDRKTSITEPNFTVSATEHKVPSAWNDLVQYGGRQEYKVNANNDISLYTYDALGRLAWVGQKDDGGWCWALQVTTYDYDGLGNLSGVTRGNNVCGSDKGAH